jgi:hypothetical protein
VAVARGRTSTSRANLAKSVTSSNPMAPREPAEAPAIRVDVPGRDRPSTRATAARGRVPRHDRVGSTSSKSTASARPWPGSARCFSGPRLPDP